MAFTSGSAATPSILLDRLNTFLTGNGWTKLRGLVDNNVASPKAARYWRVMMYETQTTSSSTWGVQLLNFRTTSGGANVATVAANFTIDHLTTGTAALLISGGSVRFGGTAVGSSRARKIQYDFGTPTVVREVVMRAGATLSESPRSFTIQWSNDGEVWTTMFEAASITWTTGETKTFTFANGYVHPNHAGAALPRRSGSAEDYAQDANWETSFRRDFSEEVFVWQGPGYDASRRVIVHMRGHTNPGSLTHLLEMSYSTGFDTNIRGWNQQAGNPGNSLFLLMGNGVVNYWFYANSHRIIIVIQSGASDYTSCYIGFMGAFAHPDYYPFPLVMVSGADVITRTHSVLNNGLSAVHDPGYGCLEVKKWDGIDYIGGNRSFDSPDGTSVGGSGGATVGYPTLWPAFFGGSATNRRWPENKGSNTPGSMYTLQHLFEFLTPTQQNDLPLLPCIVQDRVHGNLGVLTGLYAIPGGGIVSPQQAIVISGVTYRVFPNRTRRNGASWFAVKEE